MSNFKEVKRLLAQLNDSKDILNILIQIVVEWNNDFEMEMVDILKSNKVFSSLAQVMNKDFETSEEHPQLVMDLITRTYHYRKENELFPISETRPLVEAFRKYILCGNLEYMESFQAVPSFYSIKQILLEDTELFDFIKQNLDYNASAFITNCADEHEAWQYKVLQDRKLIFDLIEVVGIDDLWGLLAILASNPDAKSLFPKEIIKQASESTDIVATFTYSLICSDDDLKSFKLDPSFIENYKQLIESMLATGTAGSGAYSFTLLDLVPPMRNLSVAETYKEELGKAIIKPFLQIVADQLLDVATIRNYLTPCKQEASRALWNLAYLKSNCQRIEEANGIERLKKAMEQTSDTTLQKNIAGILYMCAPPSVAEISNANPVVLPKGHIMISYNWANQEIIKKIAQSLTDRGYHVWLDIQQMGGSTLEAMATAVEQSELILICMSQKYKDSPNCRLEGEYCINRKVAFLPLMMQRGYAPDGWLGIALGSKLWYDFADENDWDTKINAIIKAIGERGKKSQIVTNQVSTVVRSEPTAPPEKRVLCWGDEELRNWMKQEDILEYYPAFKEHKLDGRALLELKKFLTQPSKFYTFSNFKESLAEMGIRKFGDILKISSAVSKL